MTEPGEGPRESRPKLAASDSGTVGKSEKKDKVIAQNVLLPRLLLTALLLPPLSSFSRRRACACASYLTTNHFRMERAWWRRTKAWISPRHKSFRVQSSAGEKEETRGGSDDEGKPKLKVKSGTVRERSSSGEAAVLLSGKERREKTRSIVPMQELMKEKERRRDSGAKEESKDEKKSRHHRHHSSSAVSMEVESDKVHEAVVRNYAPRFVVKLFFLHITVELPLPPSCPLYANCVLIASSYNPSSSIQ